MDDVIVKNKETKKKDQDDYKKRQSIVIAKKTKEFEAFMEDIMFLKEKCAEEGYELKTKYQQFVLEQPDGVDYNEMKNARCVQCLSKINKLLDRFNDSYNKYSNDTRHISFSGLTEYTLETKLNNEHDVIDRLRYVVTFSGTNDVKLTTFDRYNWTYVEPYEYTITQLSNIKLPNIRHIINNYYGYPLNISEPKIKQKRSKDIFTIIHEFICDIFK